jgi:hypothetical protein
VIRTEARHVHGSAPSRARAPGIVHPENEDVKLTRLSNICKVWTGNVCT